MTRTPPLTPKRAPLKVWSDWSAGIGFAKDGEVPGMYYAAGLLGLIGELRVAPFTNTITTSLVRPLLGWLTTGDEDTAAFAGGGAAIAPAASATVAQLGSVASLYQAGSSTTITVSVTVSSGSNRCLVVAVSDIGAAPTSVVFNGAETMTQIFTDVHPTTPTRYSLYRLVNPTVITADVVATWAAGVTGRGLIAVIYSGVHQTTPIDNSAAFSSASADAIYLNGGSYVVELTGTLNGVIVGGGVGPGPPVDDVAQTSLGTLNVGTIVLSHKLITAANVGSFNWAYALDTTASLNPQRPFLFIQRGNNIRGVHLHKVDIGFTNFGTLLGSVILSNNAYFPGQPAEHVSRWYLPSGPLLFPRRLDTITTGNISTDTIGGGGTGATNGANEHLIALGNQLAGYCSELQVLYVNFGSTPGGARILSIDGTYTTEANWGSAFPVGNDGARALAMSQLLGSTYVLKRDGLYSFNARGRSGLVFEDLRRWPHTLDALGMRQWKGGLFLPHPSNLLFYEPGSAPVPSGFDAYARAQGLPPSGVTELTRGRWHGTYGIGEYLYGVYQPDPTTTTIWILVGHGEPPNLVWQLLATTTALNTRAFTDVFVSTLAEPLALNQKRPTLFFGSGANLAYIVLDERAGPFRNRADTHRVAASASAVMSEIFFPQPVDLDEIVVYTQDMAATDEFQLSLIVNATGDEAKIGRPFLGDGRDSRPLSYKRVHRLTLIVTFTATDTTSRVPPSISRIELFGGVA